MNSSTSGRSGGTIRKRGVSLPLVIALTATAIAPVLTTSAQKEATEKHRFDPGIQKIEGWTVHVDPKLLKGKHAEESCR